MVGKSTNCFDIKNKEPVIAKVYSVLVDGDTTYTEQFMPLLYLILNRNIS